MKHGIKRGLLALALGVGLSTTALAKEKIVIGELSWDGSLAIQAIMKNIMTQRLGVDVEYLAADQTVIFKGMDKGDGSVDIHPDVWVNAQRANLQKYVKEKQTVRTNDRPYMAPDGWYIPTAVAEKYGIKSIDDMKKPEVAAAFDNDGDGMGDFWPGAPGWSAVNINQVKLKSYGLDKTFKPMVVSDAVFKSQLEAALKKDKGMLFYYWEPEWLHTAYKLTKLEEPKFTGYASEDLKDDPDYNPSGCYKMADPKKDPQWLQNSSITCGNPLQTVYVAYSAALEQRAPQVARFLKNFHLDINDLNDWIFKIVKDKQNPDKVAADWVAANPDKVQAWLQ
ncbi:MAG TPA: glycine betaine ABC transporter substrate-binding protein [Candidatus Competibacteraceae bacterium]|nr:glycine betaine ABC transporter substrate-binding protein [Candidatus Competibacteraceae bacterium]